MEGNSQWSPISLLSHRESVHEGYDPELVAVKVEPVVVEEENQTDKFRSADDMRHVHQDDQSDDGEVHNAEPRNQELSGLERSDMYTNDSSPVFKDHFQDKTSGLTEFDAGIDDLSEPSIIAREVAGVSVSPLSAHQGVHYNCNKYSLSYDTSGVSTEPEPSVTPSSTNRYGENTENSVNRPYSTRVRPVKGPSSCVMLTSSRGYIMLLADNYRYGKERNRGNRHYWRCRVRGCHGRAVTVRDQRHQHTLVSASEHSHPPPDGTVVQGYESGELDQDNGSSSVKILNGEDAVKAVKVDHLDRMDDDVFINGVEEGLPVFVEEENKTPVYQPREPEKAEICRTVLPKRGRLTLIAKQFMYGRDRCRNDRHYWRCRLRRCHGRAVTKYDANGNHVLVASTPHTHSPLDYPESVMAEAMENQDNMSPLTRPTRMPSVAQKKSVSSPQYHDENSKAEEGQLSPGHFSDIDLTYSGLDGFKESITIVHPKEIGEETPSPTTPHMFRKINSTRTGEKVNRIGSKSLAKLDICLSNGSPDVDDPPQFSPMHVKERKSAGSQSDPYRPRLLSHHALDYEPLSDTDCPVGDDSCLCQSVKSSSKGMPDANTETEEGHNHGHVSTKSVCHLVKSDTGVWYLVVNGHAHLKDNIQRDRHFWKCHYCHCSGQAITRLNSNTHTLIGFTPHRHSPMTTLHDLKQVGLQAQGASILLDETDANSTTHPGYMDLNSHSFLPTEVESFEICKHIISRRGKHMLLARGYSFGIERNRNDRYYWRCKIRGCRGRAVTKMLSNGNHSLLHFANHMHPPLGSHDSCVVNNGTEEQHVNSCVRDFSGDSFHDDHEVIEPDKGANVFFPQGRPSHGRSFKGTVKYRASFKDYVLPSRNSYYSPEYGNKTPGYSEQAIDNGERLLVGLSRPNHAVSLHQNNSWDAVHDSQFHSHNSKPTISDYDFHMQKSPQLYHRSPSSPPSLRIQDVRYSVQTTQTSPADLLHYENRNMLKRSRCSDNHSPLLPGGKRFCASGSTPSLSTEELKLGEKIIEGKTKVVYALPDFKDGGYVLLESKDRITCGDGARADDMQGKAQLSTATTSAIFEFLNQVGIKTHFLQKHTDTKFIAQRCEMVPLEFVTRRIATGSFLRRNPGVKEGFRFAPPLLETFYKDDANHDPQWSRQQCLEAQMKFGGVTIGRRELDIMGETTVAVFEILEKAWAFRNCVLVDMKLEFGINPKTKEILLADVIDNDSWRLWPGGDKRLMRDKQVYRNLREVTPLAMEEIKKNYKWVADETKALLCKPNGRIVIFMGSASDKEHSQKIQKFATQYGVPSEARVTSAHKGTEETLKILRGYEAHGVPTVFIAIAGRSNGLGPVLSGNTAYPVINCPPIKADWGTSDIWSSLRLPSGLGCTTVMDPQAAALAAAQIIGMNDHVVWSTMRANRLSNLTTLMKADCELESAQSA